MTPEEAQRLQACAQEIAAILYTNTPTEELKTLEGIEKAVRQQMLKHVSPEVGVFLSSRLRELSKANPDSSKVV